MAEVERLAAYIQQWASEQNEWDVGTVLSALAVLDSRDLELFARVILDGEQEWRTDEWQKP